MGIGRGVGGEGGNTAVIDFITRHYSYAAKCKLTGQFLRKIFRVVSQLL